MTAREVLLTPLDLDLVRELEHDGRLVEACHRLGIGRDRGLYRLRRLTRALGRPVATGTRGGASHGRTLLTPEGRGLLHRPVGSVLRRRASPNDGPRGIVGTWRPGDPPTVDVGRGLRLAVAFRAEPGEPVWLSLDPESILVATQRFPSSARNVLPGRVLRIRRTGAGRGSSRWELEVGVGAQRIGVAVTPAAVRSLRLSVGRPVYLYVKATSVARVAGPTRGSLRSSASRRPRLPEGSASR